MPVTAKEIEQAVLFKYLVQQQGWAVLREVSIDTDEPTRRRRPHLRRIDILLMRIGRNSTPRHERIALEIKVSRADFRRDTPEKREPWFRVADRFAYVCPVGMIAKAEVPEGCGLLEFDPNTIGFSQLRWALPAPRNPNPAAFEPQFTAYLAGRASRAEAEVRELMKSRNHENLN